MSKGFLKGMDKGKLHREIGVPVDKKIPAKKLEKAEHSKNPEIKRDAIRAKTMEDWNHSGTHEGTEKAASNMMKRDK